MRAWLRGRWEAHPRRVVAALVALVVLLVGDFALAAVVDTRVQAAVASAMPGARVSTAVRGFPVSGHLLADQIGRIELDASDVQIPAEGQHLRVRRIHAVAHGVHGIRSGKDFHLDAVDGQVEVGWSELADLTRTKLVLGDDGLMTISGQVPVLGEQLPGSLTGRLVLDSRRQLITVEQPSGTLGGVTVPDAILTGLLNRFSNQLTLPTVPGLAWTGITAGKDGATLTFRGSGLTFTTR